MRQSRGKVVDGCRSLFQTLSHSQLPLLSFAANSLTPCLSPFHQWYSSQLLEHGDDMLGIARKVFGTQQVVIGMKIPVVHWWYHTKSHAVRSPAFCCLHFEPGGSKPCGTREASWEDLVCLAASFPATFAIRLLAGLDQTAGAPPSASQAENTAGIYQTSERNGYRDLIALAARHQAFLQVQSLPGSGISVGSSFCSPPHSILCLGKTIHYLHISFNCLIMVYSQSFHLYLHAVRRISMAPPPPPPPTGAECPSHHQQVSCAEMLNTDQHNDAKCGPQEILQLVNTCSPWP